MWCVRFPLSKSKYWGESSWSANIVISSSKMNLCLLWVVLSRNGFTNNKHPNKFCHTEFVRQVTSYRNPFACFKSQGSVQLFSNKNSQTSNIQDQGLGFISLIAPSSPGKWWIPFSLQVAWPSFPYVSCFADILHIHILGEWMPSFLAVEPN